MKKIALILLLCSFSFISKVPELNAKIVEYVKSVMGTKVDRGECWDLAAFALQYSGAYFDRSTQKSVLIYGRRIDPKKEVVFPGDIIQFENVSVKWTEGNSTYTETMGHHTAIVYEVKATGDYDLAHQNTQAWGKKVGVSNFKLDRVTKGSIMIYRPIKEKE